MLLAMSQAVMAYGQGPRGSKQAGIVSRLDLAQYLAFLPFITHKTAYAWGV